MLLQQIVWKGVDWIDLSQDRGKQQSVVNTGNNLHVPYDVWNFLTSWGTVSFSRTVLHGVHYGILQDWDKAEVNQTLQLSNKTSQQKCSNKINIACWMDLIQLMCLYHCHVFIQGIYPLKCICCANILHIWDTVLSTFLECCLPLIWL